ncbi:MAG: flavin-containing monooxygenase [Solirubrobacterales bacterium]
MEAQLSERTSEGARAPEVEQFETVIVGGGQAGLAIGYHLANRGRSFVILDAHERIGDAWRKRWDSLRLFTPAGHDNLPGMGFPAPHWSFPTRDEMAEYLETYATEFDLPVRSGVRVDSLAEEGGRYLLAAGDRRFEADQVVIATGPFQAPKVPAFAPELDPRIVQMHSSEYRNPSQLPDGGVLVVGPGNSGADIALDVAGTHRTWLSGEHPGHIPLNTTGTSGRLAFPLIWFVWTHVLNVGTPVGRKARPKVLAGPEPLIRVKPKHLAAAGVERVARTSGVKEGLPELEDGTVMDVASVIWATGYRRELGWIDLDGFDADIEPDTDRGVIEGQPGVYLLGREFLYAFNSHTIGGVGRDAEHIAERIAARVSDG